MDAVNQLLPTDLEMVYKDPINKTCDIHGEYVSKVFSIHPSRSDTETPCQKCADEKEARRKDEQDSQNFRNRHDQIIRSFTDGDLPPRFRTKDFAGYIADSEKSKRALNACQRYADNFETRLEAGGGMVFCGEAGTGKTHLASAIINRIINDRYVSVFMSALGATRHVKATYAKDSYKSEAEAIKDFLRPDLLVIDEVGVQFGTDAEKIILFEIINQRYQHVKPTILISNLTLIELSEYIGERVVDRMYEGGGAILSFDWDSHRRANR